MKIIRDGLLLCEDCLIVAVNGDESGIESEAQRKATEAGLDKLGPHLVPDFDRETGRGVHEFTWRGCDCCGSSLGGSRHEFAILGEETDHDDS